VNVRSTESESSVELLQRVREGDQGALDRLLRRYVPALRRWARGRLPVWARDMADTEDLVQDTVVRSLQRLNHFEQRHDGALQAYLRQAVMNRIRDECRRVSRRPAVDDLNEQLVDRSLSPLESAIGSEAYERYERALRELRPGDQEAIVARVELGHSYNEVAMMLAKSSPDAARVAVSRAIVRLAELLSRGR